MTQNGSGTTDRDGTAVDVTAPTEALEGDDIVVIPDEGAHPSRSRRLAVVVGVLVAVTAIVVVVALVAGGNKHGSRVIASNPNPNIGRTAPAPAASAPKRTKTKRHASAAHAPVTAAPVVVAPSVPQASTPAPTAPPALAQYPPSALQWTAPASLTIAHNAQTTITVVAHNPTNGTITLPHPLSCTPTLSGTEMCVEMAQILRPGESATAVYKIDGAEVAPGNYTLDVEGVLKIKVRVTAAS